MKKNMKKKDVTLESLDTHIKKVEKKVDDLNERVDDLECGNTRVEVIKCSESDLPPKEKRVRVEYQYIPKTLNDYTPEELSRISKSGKAEEYFSVGETLTIYFDDEPHTATIIAFNHYKDDKGNPCGITFQLDNLEYREINEEYTNKGGYICSDLREYLEDIFNDTNITDGRNPSWKNYIRKTKIDCYVNHTGLVSVDDHFFIPSVYEIYGDNISSDMGPWYDDEYKSIHKQEGTPIPYLYSHRAKGHWYWTRSAYLADSYYFWFVDDSGGLDSYYATDSRGVALCFSI